MKNLKSRSKSGNFDGHERLKWSLSGFSALLTLGFVVVLESS